MHRIHFDQINGHDAQPYDLDVHATPEELEFFAKNGYLVVENVFSPEQLETLRNAVARQVQKEFGENTQSIYGKNFGGHFLRGLLDKDEAFHTLLFVPQTLSIIRAMMGPRVQIRSCSSRITYPGTNQQTLWHMDQPSWIEPRPPFFAYPPVINCIYFLDDVTPEMGPLSVVPGTHSSSKRPPQNYYGPIEGQIDLCVKAGTAVLTHCGIWHKGGPNTEKGSIRRNLLVDHSPVWMKDAYFGGVPSWGGPLTRALLEKTDDPLVRDLLGQGGVH